MKNGVLKGVFATFRVCMMLLFCIKTDAQFAPSWGGVTDFASKEAFALGKEALQGFDHVLTGDANITSFFIDRIGLKKISIIKSFIKEPMCIDSMSKRMFSFVKMARNQCCFNFLKKQYLIEKRSRFFLSNSEKYKKICLQLKGFTVDSEGEFKISFKKVCKKTFKEYVIKPSASSACSQASGYVIGRVAGAVAPKSLVDKAALLHIPLFIPAIIRTNAHVVKWFDIKLDLRKVPGFSRVDKNNKFVNNAQIKVMPFLSGMVHGFNASAHARLSA